MGENKKTEEILGFNLITKSGSRGSYQLSEFGRELMEKFQFWFDKVEQDALAETQKIFPWSSRMYKNRMGE